MFMRVITAPHPATTAVARQALVRTALDCVAVPAVVLAAAPPLLTSAICMAAITTSCLALVPAATFAVALPS